MGELLDRLQAAGVMPAPNAVDGAAAAAAAGRTSAYTSDVEWCFQPGPEDPKEEDYAVVKCYTRQLQVRAGGAAGGAVERVRVRVVQR